MLFDIDVPLAANMARLRCDKRAARVKYRCFRYDVMAHYRFTGDGGIGDFGER